MCKEGTIIMNEINRRFKQFRLATNITQDELAQSSGISVYTIKKFENGSDIKISTLSKLLSSLGIKDAFDEIIPDMTNRPSYRAKQEQGVIKQRARKTKIQTDWKWGD